MSTDTSTDTSPENQEVILEYTPSYDTDHIRISLKAGESHPCEIFAADVFRNLPVEYIKHSTERLAETLKEHPDHPMGVVWETLRRMQNGEKVADRYLMGAALYISNTLFSLGMAGNQALQAQVALLEKEEQEVDVTNSEEAAEREDESEGS